MGAQGGQGSTHVAVVTRDELITCYNQDCICIQKVGSGHTRVHPKNVLADWRLCVAIAEKTFVKAAASIAAK